MIMPCMRVANAAYVWLQNLPEPRPLSPVVDVSPPFMLNVSSRFVTLFQILLAFEKLVVVCFGPHLSTNGDTVSYEYDWACST